MSASEVLPKYPLTTLSATELATRLKSHFRLTFAIDQLADLLLALDGATETDKLHTQLSLAEASGINQSTISRGLVPPKWLSQFVTDLPKGLKLNRLALDNLLVTSKGGPVERIKTTRTVSINDRRQTTDKGYFVLRVIPPVNLHPQLQSIYGKEGIIADEWKQYVMQTGPRQLNELVCFIKWAQDNPLANPYDLGMFPPDSFGKEVYQTDPQFRVAEWQSFILENLAALSIEKIQFYFMLYLWLMSTKEIAPNFNNTHYLKAIVDIIPRQTKAHLQANFEFFTFLDEFHWKA